MDAQLADELRQATDELLDIQPLQASASPPSPHLRNAHRFSASQTAATSAPPRFATFSSGSKLQVLHSPTDVRPWQWPVPPAPASSSIAHQTRNPSIVASERTEHPIKIELGTSLLDDADDNLPSRGLSTRVRSVKAATAHDDDQSRVSASALYTADAGQDIRAASPSKLRVRTPINDIYINQYGERVVQGKVVGRILGGRPRPPSRDETVTPLSDREIPSSQLPSKPVEQQLSPSKHNAATATSTSPPAFFRESFPDAFTAGPSTPPTKKKEKPSSQRGPPSLIKAPRAVAGALTLDHTDDVQDARMLRDASFQTASDFGSPSSSSSKQLSFSPGLRQANLSPSPSRNADRKITLQLQGLQLDRTERGKSSQDSAELGLLSPGDGGLSTDSARTKIELPSFRRPTPTIELSQAKADPVVLHGNKRQARASWIVQALGEFTNDTTPSVSATSPAPMPSSTSQGRYEKGSTGTRTRSASASEPSSPHLLPRHTRGHDHPYTDTRRSEADQRANKDVEGDDDDRASLESAPSSLISLPVSTPPRLRARPVITAWNDDEAPPVAFSRTHVTDPPHPSTILPPPTCLLAKSASVVGPK